MQPNPKSVLSVDVGRKRIGLAGCDQLGITISPLPPLLRKSFLEDLAIIKNYCNLREVKGLVIGVALDQEGLITNQARYCQRYGLKLAQSLGLPVAWVNEHSSSWEAKEKYNLHDDRTGKLDSICAALLLEQWLREGPELQPVQMPA